MRKRITGEATRDPTPAGPDWLDLERLAEVEVTSEDPGHPIESALTAGRGTGWRAAGPGEQVVRLALRRAGPAAAGPRRVPRGGGGADAGVRPPVVGRRRGARSGRSSGSSGTFSPPGTTEEVEEYRVRPARGRSALELDVTPDISGGDARASLAELRVA